jgi:LemA protein
MDSSPVYLILLIFGGVALVIVIVYVVKLYNSLVQVKNNVEKAFKNIDVLLKQRHDELPKLIETCKGYMKYEDEILEKLTDLRENYDASDSMSEKTRVENELNRQYLALAGRWEAYPDLKAQKSFNQIQERISGLEAAIADRRELFNDSVNILNIQIARFPEMILAGIFKYKKLAYLEVPDKDKADVGIDFS